MVYESYEHQYRLQSYLIFRKYASFFPKITQLSQVEFMEIKGDRRR